MVRAEGDRVGETLTQTHIASHPLVMQALDTVIRVARKPLVCSSTSTPIRTKDTSCGSKRKTKQKPTTSGAPVDEHNVYFEKRVLFFFLSNRCRAQTKSELRIRSPNDEIEPLFI